MIFGNTGFTILFWKGLLISLLGFFKEIYHTDLLEQKKRIYSGDK